METEMKMTPGREQHLTAHALSIAIAVMESVPSEWQAWSDMRQWEEMLADVMPQEIVRELYRNQALRTVASIGTRPLRPAAPEPAAD